MSVTSEVRPPEDGAATRPLVEVVDLFKSFDLSKPWLNRIVEREPERFVKAVDGVSFSVASRGSSFTVSRAFS